MSNLPTPTSSVTPRGNAGFTLVEMVITVAVMAILVSISTPAIVEFLRRKDVQSEEIAMGEVRKALQAYLADTGELPDNLATGADAWYNRIASYTNLSPNEISLDVWGQPRRYVMFMNSDRKMFGNNVNVYYVTLHSKGLNRDAEHPDAANTADGLAISAANEFEPADNSAWWSNKSTTTEKIDAYSAIRAGGDDLLMRFTNYPEVLDRYNETITRMDSISKALETFSRSGYAARISYCSNPSADPLQCGSLPEQLVYYPRSTPSHGGSDTASYDSASNNTGLDNGATDSNRRTGMETLMRMLGLPLDYCCSALELGTDKKPKPFYYFSNPRARIASGGCGPRPGLADAKLPARLTTKNNGDTSSDPTCG